MSTKQRLLANRSIDERGCWLWTKSCYGSGYGQTSYPECGLLNVAVHRVAAHLWLGFDLDSGLFVLHHCDVPACFNPEHLFIGTKADNSADMVRKGRGRNKPAPRKPRSTVDAALVMVAGGASHREAARRIGVSHTSVSDWVRQAHADCQSTSTEAPWISTLLTPG